MDSQRIPMTGEVMSGLSANTQDGAQLDIAADGLLWGGGGGGGGRGGGVDLSVQIFDVKVFNLHPSNLKAPSATCYRSHENEKKRKYDRRIREVEHASFTPLILSCMGGLGPQATTSYKHLAFLLSTKWSQA